MTILSIVIPAYNEKNTILLVIKAVESVVLEGITKEIIVVDDCSTDGTRDILTNLKNNASYKIIFHEKNRGKGGALRTGFAAATGEYIIVQDADLEYNPQEYPLLLKPILDGEADMVYGSRFIGGRPHRVLRFWHMMGNRIITLWSNMFSNLFLTDVATCYKVFTKEAMASVLPKLTSERFTIEAELTARIAKAKLRVFEVGISYSARSYAEGKKIGWKDGVSFMWSIVKFNLLK
ncbi:glycosyltransferase family 2 protein [Candidatus Uhrbacteria bacterium]|nr:glycosyltransferase family 2 protein [Candidatus Uhrbacteria bacterium]